MKKVIEKSEYDMQAEKFLKDTGTEFKAVFLKHDKYFDDDEETRDIYEITLKRGSRQYTFKFGQSIANSARYVYYSVSKGHIAANDRKIINKLVGRHVSLGELKLNLNQKEPSAYDVLACLTKYDPGTFKDFCSEFGYDPDSRKAEKTYNAVVDEYENLKMLYSDEELEKMQEIQ